MDIEKAIEIEERYIENRLNGQEVTPLNASIQECGFDTLDDYFEAKNQQYTCEKEISEIKNKINAITRMTILEINASKNPLIFNIIKIVTLHIAIIIKYKNIVER